MKAAIGGEAGLLGPAEVSEVWTTGEVVLRFLKPGDGAERVLLKGADTTFVADGYRFLSDRAWKVTGKQTYSTVGGVERSILVAEPVAGSGGYDGCVVIGRATGWCRPREHHIVQILNDKEMLITMHVSTGRLGGRDDVVLLRGVDTSKLTEDSPPPFNGYTGGPKPEKIGKYPITGTYRFKSTNGTTRTVFVADAGKAEADRRANEKHLEEEEQKKAEAEKEVRKAREAEEQRKANAEKARWHTWSDSDGTSQFEARVIGIINGNVVLKRQDGTVTRVPLEKLSSDDQEWLEQWKKEHSKPR